MIIRMIANSNHAAGFASQADYIREIERVRTQALVSRDMELAWQLHSTDYQLVTPSGVTFTRDRYLGQIETGKLKYIQWSPGPVQVRVSQTMAVVRYPVTLELDSGAGRGTPFRCWHTDTYELNEGLWQAVWSQATAITAVISGEPHA